MPYCANCGTEVTVEDRFCPKCGHPNEALSSGASPAAGTTRPLASSPVTVSASASSAPPQPHQAFPSSAAVSSKKKLSGCAIAGIVGGAALILLMALAGIAIVLAFALSSDSVDAMKEHLTQLGQGKIERAYQGTSTGFRSVTSLEQYRAFVDSYPALTTVASSTFNERSVENDIATIGGTIADADGRSSAIRAQLIKEDGQWKVMAVELPGANREAQNPPGTNRDAGNLRGEEGAVSWTRQGGAGASSVRAIVIGAGRDSGGSLLLPGQALAPGFSALSADIQILDLVPGERVRVWIERGADRTESTDVMVDGAGEVVLTLDLPLPTAEFSPGLYSLVVELGEARTFHKEFEIR